MNKSDKEEKEKIRGTNLQYSNLFNKIHGKSLNKDEKL